LFSLWNTHYKLLYALIVHNNDNSQQHFTMTDLDLASFKKAFAEDSAAALSDDFFKNFHAEGSWSIWRCTYDYADDNENLDATKDIVASFIKNSDPVIGKVFGVMHVLEPSLEIEGLLIVEGTDPEVLFGANEDTSWFTWSQLGPSITDGVKKEILALWAAQGDYKGKTIAETSTF
jgi:hypothetical protein